TAEEVKAMNPKGNHFFLAGPKQCIIGCRMHLGSPPHYCRRSKSDESQRESFLSGRTQTVYYRM
ncbi:hypothetical protein, partial [Enterococcus faecium]|uniref:hypothetical protein n=1 Tax=Enterococcus faecium TaxID=1352 RepID=UPI000BC6B1A0